MKQKRTKTIFTGFLLILFATLSMACGEREVENTGTDTATVTDYPVVGTAQVTYYDATKTISAPGENEAFFGQNAAYPGNTPNYLDNNDGTITDLVTGLVWQKSPDTDGDGKIDYSDKLSYEEALEGAQSFELAGYDDWRLPTIKELYSLIVFIGIDPSGYTGSSVDGLEPFIDTNYFDFAYGDVDAGERIIDAQFASSTLYVSQTMNNASTMFGVNFADGRIKGYPKDQMPNRLEAKKFYVLYVRGNTNYGINSFVQNSDGTVLDQATSLMWTQDDSGEALSWEEALAYAENSEIAGYTDWRLPDAKELQSIVDYTRSPSTSNSAAIDPVFNCTAIASEAGEQDYAYYWTSTTHVNNSSYPGEYAAYVCFGRAMGYMPELGGWVDVHGAGAQRSDPKTGSPDDYPHGHGPQGDAIRIQNFVRLVRNVN